MKTILNIRIYLHLFFPTPIVEFHKIVCTSSKWDPVCTASLLWPLLPMSQFTGRTFKNIQKTSLFYRLSLGDMLYICIYNKGFKHLKNKKFFVSVFLIWLSVWIMRQDLVQFWGSPRWTEGAVGCQGNVLGFAELHHICLDQVRM